MDLFERYYTLSLQYLTRRPRSEKEIRDYLKKKICQIRHSERSEESRSFGIQPQDDNRESSLKMKIIEDIIIKLKQQKFLSDEEFAQWFIRSRKEYRKKSDRLIKMELRQKGITDEVYEKAFHNMENKKTDTESAAELVEKKFGRYKHLPKQELYQKLGAFLARRGFDWDTIKAAIDSELNRS